MVSRRYLLKKVRCMTGIGMAASASDAETDVFMAVNFCNQKVGPIPMKYCRAEVHDRRNAVLTGNAHSWQPSELVR